ncbi:hypothetical protein I6F48_00360 [Pseudoalteromonas sp. SWYJ118]|jgi:(2Fe-2S) ferredoxin|uniref:hypothetical protein n=1 Tax=Pseudoalteromonas sp. SWYJ118 TaxID=2792062 RepID=UPI0018CE2A68|nr:hypothetical protein [Pseudoalteromonas sp. SWYJ118]MBH0074016.1 hypothetical protein [Pseudoalteromonas sp. SWYJ118]
MLKYWIGIKAKPDGMSFAIGPYNSADEANLARNNEKANDLDVSVWFTAEKQEDADKIAKWHLEGGTHPMHNEEKSI